MLIEISESQIKMSKTQKSLGLSQQLQSMCMVEKKDKYLYKHQE